ncbi:MAG TPA: cupredoxin domain-containing protein [Flavobacteriales bacterium]|nr:cupredoxin domain-containing protein [Flavobacteriales bacterium]
MDVTKKTLLPIPCGLNVILTIAIGLCLSFSSKAIEITKITLELADYRFDPENIEVIVGTPVHLILVNSDSLTPHNIIINEPGSGLDVNVDVGAGKTVELDFTPTVPGNYSFFCDKRLLFFKSHREKGMEGTLTVLPNTSHRDQTTP